MQIMHSESTVLRLWRIRAASTLQVKWSNRLRDAVRPIIILKFFSCKYWPEIQVENIAVLLANSSLWQLSSYRDNLSISVTVMLLSIAWSVKGRWLSLVSCLCNGVASYGAVGHRLPTIYFSVHFAAARSLTATLCVVASPNIFAHGIIMVALCNRADHYIFILFLLSFFFLSFFSSPNLSGRRLDVYHTLAHGVALVRI